VKPRLSLIARSSVYQNQRGYLDIVPKRICRTAAIRSRAAHVPDDYSAQLYTLERVENTLAATLKTIAQFRRVRAHSRPEVQQLMVEKPDTPVPNANNHHCSCICFGCDQMLVAMQVRVVYHGQLNLRGASGPVIDPSEPIHPDPPYNRRISLGCGGGLVRITADIKHTYLQGQGWSSDLEAADMRRNSNL
jgi:hypothetical protein